LFADLRFCSCCELFCPYLVSEIFQLLSGSSLVLFFCGFDCSSAGTSFSNESGLRVPAHSGMQREEELEEGVQGVQMGEGTLSTLSQMREERAQQDKQQLAQINTLLEHWSEQLVAKTRAIVQEIRPTEGVPAVLTDLASDMKGRGHTLLATVQEAHNRQLGVLKASISEERRQFAQAQLAFEQTLKTRYECMVDALHEKMKAEQEARMQRALDNLEVGAIVFRSICITWVTA
jgi:hypothetical protein